MEPSVSRRIKTNGMAAKQFRDRLAISQADLAEKAGVSLRIIADIEADRGASGESIRLIAAVLGIDHMQLIDLRDG
jgi:transcriptional regulator with XRE-family HTH domain